MGGNAIMKDRVVYIFTLLVCALSSCQQAQDIKAFTEANYRLEGVEDVKINGVDLEDRMLMKRNISQGERDSLLLALTTNQLRVNASLGLQVMLPEPSADRTLTVTSLTWLLQVEGEDALTGTIEETMVLREGLNTIPIDTPVLLTEDNGQPNYAGLSRIINLLSQNKDIRQHIVFMIKPTVKTPLGNVETPNFITVSKPAASS